MLKKKIENDLNTQVNHEFYSAYLYLAMSAFATNQGLAGIAHWLFLQYKEETEHALKIVKYLQDKGGDVTLLPLGQPVHTWNSALEMFEAAYKHERGMTKTINELVDLVIAERDHSTHNFLQWFVSEQVEEEATIQAILDKIKLLQNSNQGLYLLDQELGERPQ